ncbi:MAG: hypothetical protein KF753_14175 [Caldilineaceae bacterium]|nr:hypothetical protein [Caldilineaceae bacterium]
MSEPFVIPSPTSDPYALEADSQRQPGVLQSRVARHEWRSEAGNKVIRLQKFDFSEKSNLYAQKLC